ncbi:hypothetical protein BGZ47_005014 [Haplosporangium gracile]|nr:hypothetical protein BGZ47_005014 [Haplosporangium gracile]
MLHLPNSILEVLGAIQEVAVDNPDLRTLVFKDLNKVVGLHEIVGVLESDFKLFKSPPMVQLSLQDEMEVSIRFSEGNVSLESVALRDSGQSAIAFSTIPKVHKYIFCSKELTGSFNFNKSPI